MQDHRKLRQMVENGRHISRFVSRQHRKTHKDCVSQHLSKSDYPLSRSVGVETRPNAHGNRPNHTREWRRMSRVSQQQTAADKTTHDVELFRCILIHYYRATAITALSVCLSVCDISVL